ncbi:MAG: hypothetical protein JW719_13250, partial [Pirellulales bacterium]|nr:hypothetical protein [Pirellulales bacterium]
MDWGPVSAYARGQDQAPTPPSVYLHAIRRHWLPGLLIGVILAGACGVGTWLLLPKRYTARSGILVSWKKDSLLPNTNSYVQQQEYEVFKATQAQLVRSPVVLMAALRKPGITELNIYKREAVDSIGWLRDDLSVGFPADSEIMQVSLTDNDGKEVTQVVQAVVESYLSEIVETERNQKARELTNLAEVLASKEREIRAKRTA